MNEIAHLRSWLFVPGNAPARFDKAVATGADAVILDLEDAVRKEDKGEARHAVRRWLNGTGRAWVRINSPDTADGVADLAEVGTARGLLGIVVPKAEDPSALEAVGDASGGVPLIALVETARGITHAFDIASAPGVSRLAFGSLDFAGDIGANHVPEALLLARTTLVMVSRNALLPPPIDGITTAVHDSHTVAVESRNARALGFGAKFCVHPAQVAVVRAAFSPTEAELAWAREVIAAADASPGAVTGPDGHMIDRPILDRARAIVGG